MKYHIKEEISSFLLLRETKTEEKEVRENYKNWRILEGTMISTRGVLKGIGALWNTTKFRKLKQRETQNWQMVTLKSKEIGAIFRICNVYALVLYGGEYIFWNSFEELKDDNIHRK